MTAARDPIQTSNDHAVAARSAPTHQERTVHKSLLSAAVAMSLLIPAGAALANDSDSFNINSQITAKCASLAAPSGPITLGELADGNGFLDPGVLSGDESYTVSGFWCNGPVTVSLQATQLGNTTVAVSPDPAFTRAVDFTATMAWDNVSGADASANPAATVFNTSEANTGNLVLQVTALSTGTPGAQKLVAGPYAGAITVTFTSP